MDEVVTGGEGMGTLIYKQVRSEGGTYIHDREHFV